MNAKTRMIVIGVIIFLLVIAEIALGAICAHAQEPTPQPSPLEIPDEPGTSSVVLSDADADSQEAPLGVIVLALGAILLAVGASFIRR